MGYTIAAFVVCFLLVASSLLLMFYREAMRERLSAVLAPRAAGAAPPSRVWRFLGSFRKLAGSLEKAVPRTEKEASALRHRLLRAGFRSDNALTTMYAVKAVVPVVLCVIVTLTGIYQRSWLGFAFYALAIVIGYLIPDYVLDHLIRSREDELARGLPDLLDLLVVCLEAGLSLDQAVLRAVDEMRPSYLAIADEFGLVMLEIRAGRPRADAWRGLAERNDIEAVRTMVSILIQSDQFGTGISRTLRSHAETMRTRRRQYIEELAAKTPVKLLFPLVFCVFPLLMIVILGPAALILSKAFKF